ncbi:hypothetical protein BC938DRAFT_470969 [Jimgerdemannia flammicorona]|uniref:Uncharacterized protein n=1 Tax=Jimgerdemannia flammicorona TaxID=994334 RepID=A0A433Q924_9FUNG|nr:hypothetical protein BC938DRAFT_470969 [Jimgerdemannia flammicorona]
MASATCCCCRGVIGEPSSFWDPSRDIARDHSFSMTTSRSDTCRRSSHRSSWTRKLPPTRPLNWTPSARLARSGRD